MVNFIKGNWMDIVLIIAALILLLWKVYTKKEKIIYDMIYYVAAEVEVFMQGEEGQKKLEWFRKYLEMKINNMPFFSRFLVRLFFNEDNIEKYLEKALQTINLLSKQYKKENSQFLEQSIVHFLDKFAKIAKEKKHFENPNLISNWQIDETNNEVKEGIKGFVRGYVEAGKDIKAGIEGGVKF